MSSNLTLEERLNILNGGKVSDATKQYLLRVKLASGIKNNDELFTVLMLTTHISEAIKETKNEIINAPHLMQEAANEVISGYINSAEISINTASANALEKLANSVSGVANKVAKEAITKSMLETAAYCILLTSMVLASVGFFAYNGGQDSGYGRRLQEENAEKLEMEAIDRPSICVNNLDNKNSGRGK